MLVVTHSFTDSCKYQEIRLTTEGTENTEEVTEKNQTVKTGGKAVMGAV
jgi:hypothetical protein